MLKAVSTLLCMLLLALALGACLGDDDDDDDESQTATPAEAPASTPDASPTATIGATATTAGLPEATATTAEASPTRSGSTGSPAASPTGESQSFSPEEARLVDMLLVESDLEGDWTQLRVEAPEDTGEPGICDAPPFPRADEKIAEVENELQSDDGSKFVLQSLTEFPEEVAIEAMQYARDIVTCEEWTDEDGTTFEVSEIAAPDLGDESYAIHVVFQVADAGELEGDFIFVRVGGLATIVTHLELGSYDPNDALEAATIAVAKLEAASNTGEALTEAEQALVDGLLALDDMPSEWDQLDQPGRSDVEDWTGLCEADLFPGANGAIGRVSARYYRGFDADSATVQQLLLAYPSGVAEEAMDFEREATTCETFSQDGTEVTLAPLDLSPLGDDDAVVQFTFETEDDETVEGAWVVVRSGQLLTVLVYTDPTGVDVDFADALAETAVSKMETVSLP